MTRGLPSIYLDAFAEVARCRSFSGAAKVLAVTQSALSQRIRNLEEQLNLTLLLRTPGGVTLTEDGAKLLRYCQMRDSLEEELLADLGAHPANGLSGHLRVGAYSSVLRSVIMPALAPLLRDHNTIRFAFVQGQTHELTTMLFQGEADLIVMDSPITSEAITSEKIGTESFVVIESSRHTSRSDVFLDNDPQDTMTETFFRAQNPPRSPPAQRRFAHDCYGIIDAVGKGLGRAIMSRHLVENEGGIQIVPGYRTLQVPVLLHRIKRPYYSRLHENVVANLIKRAPQLLGKD